MIPDFEMVNSGTGREWKISIPKVWEREGNEKNPKGMKNFHSQNSGTGREWKKTFPKFGNGKGMKKSIPKVRERESEASILGNDREREFPLTPGRIALFVRPFVRSSRFLPHLTHTIVWCVSVPNGMEVTEVADEVAH